MKFRKDLFFSPDEWLSAQAEHLLEDGETHWLYVQAKNARIALENRLEVVMNDNTGEED